MKIKGFCSWSCDTHGLEDRHDKYLYFFLFSSDDGMILKVGQGAGLKERIRHHKKMSSVNIPKQKTLVYSDSIFISATFKECDYLESLILDRVKESFKLINKVGSNQWGCKEWFNLGQSQAKAVDYCKSLRQEMFIKVNTVIHENRVSTQ